MAELASKSIKEVLDKRYGPAWHVIIGEGYAYDISVQSGAYLLMYYNGNLGCLVFKTWYLCEVILICLKIQFFCIDLF